MKSKTRAAQATQAAASSASTGAKATAVSPRASKSAAIIDLLKRDDGATLDDMMQATGWQKHSVRGFMAGTLKKKGLSVHSTKTDEGRSYRIAGETRT